jgi:ATP-dependent helicase HrpB
VVVVDAEQRQKTLARMVSAIEPEWLLDLAEGALRDVTEVLWNAEARRVEVVSRLLYDKLTLEERRRPPGDAEAAEAARLLAAEARAAGLEKLVDPEALEALRGRLAFVAAQEGKPLPDEEQALRDACAGCVSFADIDGGAILAALRAPFAGVLDRLAPARLPLPSGRQARVHYEPGKPPWIASRLQDFFGLKESPRVGGGRVAVVVHLLAPNQRPVQVTTDLAGFWTRHYPELRKQLMRRYPKHAWPEEP